MALLNTPEVDLLESFYSAWPLSRMASLLMISYHPPPLRTPPEPWYGRGLRSSLFSTALLTSLSLTLILTVLCPQRDCSIRGVKATEDRTAPPSPGFRVTLISTRCSDTLCLHVRLSSCLPEMGSNPRELITAFCTSLWVGIPRRLNRGLHLDLEVLQWSALVEPWRGCWDQKVGTLCIRGQVCLLSRYSLVLTCVVCLEIEEKQLYSFRARGD